MVENNKLKWFIYILGICPTKVVKDRVIVTQIYKHENYKEDLDCTEDGSKTLLDLFNNVCKTYKNKEYLGTVDNNTDVLSWQTYGEIEHKVKKVASFLSKYTDPKNIIGIFSINRYEWLVCEYASYMAGCSISPIYTNAKDESKALVVEETEMKICCVSLETAKNLYEILKEENNSKLKHLILFDKDDSLVVKFEELNISVHFFDDIIAEEEINLREVELTGDDIATICYTSGTGGKAKGVILTHKNFISTIAAFSRGSENEIIKITSQDVYLSYLPLAHVMERVCVAVMSSVGASIGFYRGHPEKAEKDYQVIRPTFIAAVPHVLAKFKERIMNNISNRGIHERIIFNLALKYKVSRQSEGIFEDEFFDSKIFNKVKERFGGRIKAILCGSAACSPELLSFMQAVFSVQIFQGYGQTETTGATTLKPIDLFKFNNVGIPFPSNQVKIVSVNEDGEHYGDNCGELYVKGNNVTKGYFKNPEATKKLFDEDGWLKTGDIVKYEKLSGGQGVFKIVGRANARFKIGHGEYIDPEELEEKFKSELIDDVFIALSKDHSKLVAIVVTNKKNATYEEVCKHFDQHCKKLIKEKKISKIEKPSYIHMIKKGFGEYEEANLLTPTFKKRRNEILKFFAKDLEKLYN